MADLSLDDIQDIKTVILAILADDSFDPDLMPSIHAQAEKAKTSLLNAELTLAKGGNLTDRVVQNYLHQAGISLAIATFLFDEDFPEAHDGGTYVTFD